MSNILQWLTDLGQKPAAEQVAFVAKLPSGMLFCRKRVSDLMDICEKAFGTSSRSVLEQGKKCIERIVAKNNGETDPLDEAKKTLELDLQSHTVLIAGLKELKKSANSWTVFNITTNIDDVIAKISELEESGDRIIADISHAARQMADLAQDSRKKDRLYKENAISITKFFLDIRHIGKLTISWLKDIQALPSDNKIAQIPLPGYNPSSPVFTRIQSSYNYLDLLSRRGQVSFELDSPGYPVEFVQSWNIFWTMHHKNI